jgi:hypothetical protein
VEKYHTNFWSGNVKEIAISENFSGRAGIKLKFIFDKYFGRV